MILYKGLCSYLFWLRSMSEELALQATDMYAQGSSFGKISEEMEISKSRVGDLLREGIEALKNNHGNPVVQVKAELMNEPENRELIPPAFVPEYDYDGILEKTFIVKATPILRKVALNPRIFFYYEFAKKKFGWEGDVGDFLIECVEHFWKSKGYSIRIMYDEELMM